jgi:hypothetical protein
LLPLEEACFSAMLLSMLLGDRSILDLLKERSLTRSQNAPRDFCLLKAKD